MNAFADSHGAKFKILAVLNNVNDKSSLNIKWGQQQALNLLNSHILEPYASPFKQPAHTSQTKLEVPYQQMFHNS